MLAKLKEATESVVHRLNRAFAVMSIMIMTMMVPVGIAEAKPTPPPPNSGLNELNSIFGTKPNGNLLATIGPIAKWFVGIILLVIAIGGVYQIFTGFGKLAFKGHHPMHRKEALSHIVIGFVALIIAFGSFFWPTVKSFLSGLV